MTSDWDTYMEREAEKLNIWHTGQRVRDKMSANVILGLPEMFGLSATELELAVHMNAEIHSRGNGATNDE